MDEDYKDILDSINESEIYAYDEEQFRYDTMYYLSTKFGFSKAVSGLVFIKSRLESDSMEECLNKCRSNAVLVSECFKVNKVK